MTEREKRQDSPDAWADDLQAGEPQAEATDREIVRAGEQSGASSAGESRPVRESGQPADPAGPALPMVLALIGICFLIVVAIALLTTGRLGV